MALRRPLTSPASRRSGQVKTCHGAPVGASRRWIYYHYPLHEIFETAHEVVAWILAALVVLHVGAAVDHWKVRRDDVLRRMLPGAGGT